MKLNSYTLVTLPIKKVLQSRHNEDYKNDSSKYDASVFLAVMNGNKDINDIRLETFRPISVDKKTIKIIDGNHRHYAIKTVVEKNVYVILCETQGI